jgi:hypothetical protein
MSKSSVVVIGLVLLAVGFALGYVATPILSPSPARIFPPEVPQSRSPEPLLRPSPTRPAVVDRLRDVLREPDPFARVPQLAALLPALGPDAIPEVRAALDDRSLDLGGPEIDLLLRFWATHDPRGAASWAYAKSPGDYRAGAIIATIEPWAEVDPVSAFKYVQAMSLLPGESSRAGEIALVRGWFKSGLPGLEEYIQGLGISFERQRALGVFAQKTLQRDGPEAITRWAESLPDEDKKLKIDAFRRVAVALTRADPAAAVAWCDAHCEGPFGSNVRMLIAQNWAARDGLAAMQWVATAPAGQERDWAVRGAYRGWSRGDREGLMEWVEAMGVEGVEPWFQPTIDVVAFSMVAQSPGEAVKWAAAIENAADRERTLIAIARGWRKRDPSAAEAWLEQSPLSEEARAQARAPTPPGRQGRQRDPAPDDPPVTASPAP